MAEKTGIEWADATWSPWEGCTKISPGCDHCYAQAMNRWLRKGENWGAGSPRRQYGDEHWKKPLAWNAKAQREGNRLRVFPSVCDPLDNEVPPAWRQELMSLIVRTPNLDWLLLTKRIGNAKRMLSDASMHDGLLLTANDEYRPPANLWLGATIVNQEEADRDVPKLLATPAAVRFLSMEPLLGPVKLREEWLLGTFDHCVEEAPDPEIDGCRGCPGHGRECHAVRGPRLHWIIVGGESGPHARPMHPDWARSLRDQCKAAGVPFLFKQHGEWREPQPGEEFDTSLGRAAKPPAFLICERTGSVRCFDGDSAVNAKPVIRVGKKAAGRVLDGVTHDDYPEGMLCT